MQQKVHHISKLVVKMQLPGQEGAQQWLNTTASVTKAYIVQAINKVLDEFDDGTKIIRIPKIQIDLGKETLKGINTDTAHIVADRLREILLQVLPRDIKAGTIQAEQHKNIQGNIEVMETDKNETEQVLFYLENGYLPWWGKSEPGILQKVIRRIFLDPVGNREKKEKVEEERLLALLQKDAVCKRMAAQLELSTLEAFLQKLVKEENKKQFWQLVLQAAVQKKQVEKNISPVKLVQKAEKNIRPVYAKALQLALSQAGFNEWVVKLVSDKHVQVFLPGLLVVTEADVKMFKPVVETLLQASIDPARKKEWLAPFVQQYQWIQKEIQLQDNRPEREPRKDNDEIKDNKALEKQTKDVLSPEAKTKETTELSITTTKDKTQEAIVLSKTAKDKTKSATGKDKNIKHNKNLDGEKEITDPGNTGDDKVKNEESADVKNTSEREKYVAGEEETKTNGANPLLPQEKTQGPNSRQPDKKESEKQEKRTYHQQEERFNPLQYFKKEIKESLEVQHAGLVIAHPYLVPFFDALGLLDARKFKHEEAQHYAVHILYYLATGNDQLPEEHQLVLHKLLCGLEPADVLQTGFEITGEHKAECDNLLQSMIDNWPALKKTSPAALQSTFLQRIGRLTSETNGWSLKVERTTVDILLNKLPWGLGVIKTPWNNEFIFVEW